jgi:hypothetical protein
VTGVFRDVDRRQYRAGNGVRQHARIAAAEIFF